MTTLTTACGMLPLALGIGQGSELMQPLAVAVVGGLSVSTLLTLFVVPSAYLILTTGADRLGHWLTGRRSRGAIEPRDPSSPAPAPAAPTSRPLAGTSR
jgi:hypothetical protein